MQRDFAVVIPENEANGYQPGDDAAHRIGQALAERYDAPTLMAVNDALCLLERVGGQFHVISLRAKLPAEGEREEHETIGLGFRYDTKDARLKPSREPEEFMGAPIVPSHEPDPEDAAVVESEEGAEGSE